MMRNDIPFDLCGKTIVGTYFDVPVMGMVVESRLRHGKEIIHYVELNTAVEVFGSLRNSVIVNHADIVSLA